MQMGDETFDAEEFERRFNADRRKNEERRDVKRGFACGDNAKKAALKNHALGTAHRWTAAEAKAYSKVGTDALKERREGERRARREDTDR
jgi:hypothetical protein